MYDLNKGSQSINETYCAVKELVIITSIRLVTYAEVLHMHHGRLYGFLIFMKEVLEGVSIHWTGLLG